MNDGLGSEILVELALQSLNGSPLAYLPYFGCEQFLMKSLFAQMYKQ